MKNLIFTLVICIMSFVAIAQLPPKVENDQLFGKDCYYLKQMPTSPVKGVLVLIPGFGEHPYAVSAQSSIIQEAKKNGIAVLMVNLTPNNESLPIDENSITKLGNMITYFYQQEKLNPSVKLNIGGFSIGGTAALKFYNKQGTVFKVNKVFAIDPPLDMLRLRKSLEKGQEKSVITKLDSLNTNQQSPENGLKSLSVYNPEFDTSSLPDYSQTSLRIYNEPDILWWIKNRNMDLYDMNVTDSAAYINALLKKDPKQKVELILTKDKGVRNGDQIHPHSWSIAEPVDLINWLLKD